LKDDKQGLLLRLVWVIPTHREQQPHCSDDKGFKACQSRDNVSIEEILFAHCAALSFNCGNATPSGSLSWSHISAASYTKRSRIAQTRRLSLMSAMEVNSGTQSDHRKARRPAIKGGNPAGERSGYALRDQALSKREKRQRNDDYDHHRRRDNDQPNVAGVGYLVLGLSVVCRRAWYACLPLGSAS
jgi:hypothetical protein